MKRNGIQKDIGRADRLPENRRSQYFSPWFDDRWEPSRLFDEFFGGNFSPLSTEARSFAPAIDVEESADEYLVCADLPGVKKEDISIECTGNQLTLTAERKYENTEGRKQGRQERYYGNFMRSFTLPTGAEVDKIEAAYEDGVLQIHIPKGEQVKAKKIQIGEAKASAKSH